MEIPKYCLEGVSFPRSVSNFLRCGAGKVLVVSDPYLTENGSLDKVVRYMRDKGITATVFDRVEQDPPVESVIKAAELWNTAPHDAILAIGGGSSIDTAKAAGAIIAGGDIKALLQGAQPAQIPPLIAIPTTSGTGSEVSWSAVLSDLESQNKVMVRGERLGAPRVALVDPELAATMPPAVTANTGIDAFTHLLSSFINTNYNFLAQELDLVGMRLIRSYLPRAIRDGSDMEARTGVAMASVLGGIGIQTMGVDLVHTMTGPFGAHFHFPHGTIVASFLQYGLAFTRPSATESFSRVARVLDDSLRDVDDETAADKMIELIVHLLRDCNLPVDLTGFNIDPGQFPSIANKTIGRVAVKNNPRIAEEADVLNILEAAYRGDRS